MVTIDKLKDKHPNYFEGVLQLRNPTKRLLEYVKEKVRKDKKAIIVDIKKVTNGFDYYLTDQKYIRSLGKNLKDNFPGELIISSKLFSRDKLTSKEIYRCFVAFRYHGIQKGDTLMYKGEEVKVTAIGKKVLAKDIKTGKKHSINFKELRS